MKDQKTDESTNSHADNAAPDRSDTFTATLRSYSNWRRKSLTVTSRLSMTHLLLRTVYVTVCILADGLILPLVIIATNRTIISYLLFVPALGLMIFLQHKFYLRWKASWKELVDSNRGDQPRVKEHNVRSE